MAAAKKAATVRTQTFHDHLKELRLRVFAIAIVFIIASGVAYNYKDTLISLLLAPLGNQKLMFLTPAGGFSFIFQISLYAGLIAAVPVMIYNLYRFISPILSKRIQRYSIAITLSSMVLLVAGVCFGYVYAIPAALTFLTHFADGFINASLTADSYLSFVVAYTVGLGLLFQLPLVLLFIHWIYPLKPSTLLKFEKYMVLIAFILAAMITPTPDLLNQVIVATPIILMYQVGVIAICVSVHRKKKAMRAAARSAAATGAVGKPAVSSPSVPDRRPIAAAAKPALDLHRVTPVARSHTSAPKQSSPLVTLPLSTVPAAINPQRRRSVDGVLMAPARPQRVAVVVPQRSTPVARVVMQQPRMTKSLDGVSVFAIK